jgi:hypothetical protein
MSLFVEFDGRTNDYLCEDNDCTVRALAVACDLPYGAAYRTMEFAGREPHGCVSMVAAWERDNRIANYKVTRFEDARHYTVAHFLRTIGQTGRYIIRVSGSSAHCHHVIGVKNGKVYDLAHRSSMTRRRIKCCWKLEAL